MYLDTATRKPLVAVLEQQLLARHVAAILEKGFDALVSVRRAPLATHRKQAQCHFLSPIANIEFDWISQRRYASEPVVPILALLHTAGIRVLRSL